MDELGARNRREYLAKNNLRLKPGKRRADTEVDAIAECQMIVRSTRDVELVRIWKPRGVAVCRRVDHEHHRSARNLRAADLDVTLRKSAGRLHWAVKPKHLLYSIQQ